MRLTKWSAFALAICLCAFSARATQAQTSASEEWSNDQDAPLDNFEPDTRNPIGEPDFGGVPPTDWNDVRNGWLGVNEENLILGDAGYPGADPGAATVPYGVIQNDAGSSTYWSPSSWATGQTSVTFSIDIYADPVIAPNGVSPDMWWTNAVGPGYITETGMTFDAGAGAWLFQTTAGAPVALVPTGLWYEMEIIIGPGLDGDLDATHNLWDATHSVLLGSSYAPTLFLNPVNQPIVPSYSWFTNFLPNVDVVFVDDFMVTSVPEPGTMLLAGFGAVGLVIAARRRRRA